MFVDEFYKKSYSKIVMAMIYLVIIDTFTEARRQKI